MDLPPLKFIHLRYWDDDNPDVLINNAGITVCYRKPAEDELNISFARCNPQDQFNKKIGRAISAGRMQHDQFYRCKPVEGQSDFDTVVEFVNHKLSQSNHDGYESVTE